MKVLVIAEHPHRVEPIVGLLNQEGHELAQVPSGIEGNDLVLNGLARRHSFELILLHYEQDTHETRELIRYWRSQDPFLPLVLIGPESALADPELIQLGLIDCFPESMPLNLLKSRIQLLDQAAALGVTYRLKSELLEFPAGLEDPMRAIKAGLEIVASQIRARALAFIRYTANEDDPMVQIVQNIEIYDQVWLDEFCESSFQTIEPLMRSGRYKFTEEDPCHYAFPIVSSYGWEGVMLFFANERDGHDFNHLRAGQFSTLADGFRVLLEHVHARQTLERLRNQKAEYMHILSQRFRIPLSNLIMAAELLQMVEAEANVQHLANRVSQAALATSNLLEDTIELGRIDDGMLVIHPVRMSLKNHMIKLLKRNDFLFKEKSLDVELLVDDEKPYIVEGDPEKLGRVFSNLLSNAAHFSPEGGLIRIRLAMEANGWVRTSIQDQGPGIAPERFQSIFGRSLNQGDAITEKGVGLYICRKFITAHEGQIWVESEPGKGATFYVKLRPGTYVSGELIEEGLVVEEPEIN
ncbi:MAG: HAMP domain-containing histidine kinase [Acidobacteria bacterium]|nr:HAMP domain-containing histidine kinase [Acidobacteriota bacterium]MCB9396549.1 HAMP domain-containing histidine kinase [Acidobacteriota bacterium]